MTGKEKLLGIQYLRAVAALMVVYLHLTMIPGYAGYLAVDSWISTDHLRAAVPVFFVISGFVMYVSGIESAPWRFVWRRLIRIVPLYWCLTLAVALLALGLPRLLPHTQPTPEHILKSLLFLPYFSTTTHDIFPLLPPGWSLDYEMFFYAVFALALFAPRRWRLAILLVVLCCLYVIGVAFPAVRGNPLGFAYTSRLLFLFAIGLILGWLYRRGSLALPKSLAATVTLLGFYALLGSATPGWVSAEIAPACIVLGVVSLDSVGATPRWPWLLTLGDASYSIYLVHPFALDAVEKIWLRLNFHSAAGLVMLGSSTAIAMALMTCRLIERPSLAVLSRRSVAKAAEGAAPGGPCAPLASPQDQLGSAG